MIVMSFILCMCFSFSPCLCQGLSTEEIELGSVLLSQKGIRFPYEYRYEFLEPTDILIQNNIHKFVNVISRDKVAMGEALMFCCQKNFEQTAIFFVNLGARLDIVDENNQNILHAVAKKGSLKLLIYIIKEIARDPRLLNYLITSHDIDNNTPIIVALNNFNLVAYDYMSEVNENIIFALKAGNVQESV